MVDGILGQVELAALPRGAGQDGTAGSAQARVVIADDELDAAHAAVHEVVEEIPPMNLGLGQGSGHAQ